MMRYLLLVIFLLSIPSTADACRSGQRFQKDHAQKATVIFSGEVLAYEQLDNEFVTAKLKFKVDKVYRGKAGQTIDVVWQNSTFAIPANLSDFKKHYSDILIVGLIDGEYEGHKNQKLNGLPKIFQYACSPPFMFSKEEIEKLGIIISDLN